LIGIVLFIKLPWLLQVPIVGAFSISATLNYYCEYISVPLLSMYFLSSPTAIRGCVIRSSGSLPKTRLVVRLFNLFFKYYEIFDSELAL